MTKEENMQSLIGWLKRRIERPDITFEGYVYIFRMMWIEEFGTLDNIPEDVLEEITDKHKMVRGSRAKSVEDRVRKGNSSKWIGNNEIPL